MRVFHYSTFSGKCAHRFSGGVAHRPHPPAGIDSARLLLFSGDDISYTSDHRAQSNLNGPELFWRCFDAQRRACSTHALGGLHQPLNRQL